MVEAALFGFVVGAVLGFARARRRGPGHHVAPRIDPGATARADEIAARAALARERAAEVRSRRRRHLRTLREQRAAEQAAYMRGAIDAAAGRPKRPAARRRPHAAP